MKQYPYRIAAVFADSDLGYQGNPAAVISTEQQLSSNEMQEIATSLGQPATTFLTPGNDTASYHVRWFAPDAEIGLCGHGAAAAAAFLGELNADVKTFTLDYGAGEMQVSYLGLQRVKLLLDPIPVIHEVPIPEAIAEGLGIPLLAMYETGNKHILLAESESAIRGMTPDYEVLRKSDIFGYAVTALGEHVDFVSRTLVPHVQQLEDHATGSSHAMLVPFWAEKLGKHTLVAHQLSARGGAFDCRVIGDKVSLTGEFVWIK